jgi:integrative and conjugative element protein (TIGR02256 family)
MCLANEWVSQDHKMLLYFETGVIDQFLRYIQFKETAPESGGLLLGTVHGDHFIVKEITTPTIWDKCHRYLFKRSPIGHAKVAEDRWNRSNGFVRYIGEWHTHPEDNPTPSFIDITEWRKLAEVRSDKRPLLGVIVGRKDLHIELISSGGQRTIFTNHSN